MYIHVYTWTYMYICIYINMHAYTYIYIHIYIYIYTHKYIQIHTNTYKYAYIHTYTYHENTQRSTRVAPATKPTQTKARSRITGTRSSQGSRTARQRRLAWTKLIYRCAIHIHASWATKYTYQDGFGSPQCRHEQWCPSDQHQSSTMHTSDASREICTCQVHRQKITNKHAAKEILPTERQ